jgi:hypothetical protein
MRLKKILTILVSTAVDIVIPRNQRVGIMVATSVSSSALNAWNISRNTELWENWKEHVTRRRICSKGCWVKRMTWIISSMVNSCAVAEAHLILQVAYDMAVPRPVVLWMVSVWYHFCHSAFRELVCRFKFFKLHFFCLPLFFNHAYCLLLFSRSLTRLASSWPEANKTIQARFSFRC